MTIPLVSKNRKKILIGVLVLAIGLLAGARWFFTYSSIDRKGLIKKAASAKGSTSLPAVQAFVCKKVKFVDELVMTGNLQGGARVELRFNREGRIAAIHHRVGDTVKKGAAIAQLETGEAKIKRQQAEAELSQAVNLYKAGAIAKPRLTQARLAAQLARQEFNRSFLKAPRSGSLGELNAEVGEFVTPQITVATLVSVEKIFVEMGVIEKDLSKLHAQQTVQISVETYPHVAFKGRMTQISPIVEGTSRTRTVRAEFDNKEGLLLPGMFAEARIFIREKSDALVIPATALRRSAKDNTDSSSSIFVIAANNRLKETPVQIRYEGTDYIELGGGVEPGTKIVNTLSDQIRNGIPVEVIEEVAYEAH